MGFRNPVTTAVAAAAVDTRVTPAGAGVRIYEDNSDAIHPRGVLAFTSGFFGDTDATVTQHSTANQRAQNASDTGGLKLSGGSYGGSATPAPSLDLTTVNNGDGTYSPVAALTGGTLTVDQPIKITDSAGGSWQGLSLTGTFVAWDGSSNWPAYRRNAAGLIQLRGVAKVASGASVAAGASVQLGGLPTGFFLPGSNAWRVVAMFDAAGNWVANAQAWVEGAAGHVNVHNTTTTTATAGYGFSLGFTIDGP